MKQHLAALRMLFDWLVTGHVIETNPAHAVRGPKYVVTRGKTPVLTTEEARALLDSIDPGTLSGLRDRALIGVMVYTFARVKRRHRHEGEGLLHPGPPPWLRVRLHEKGGKEHAVPCHHTLEKLLDDYIAAPPASPHEPDGPLFPQVRDLYICQAQAACGSRTCPRDDPAPWRLRQASRPGLGIIRSGRRASPPT